MLVAHVRSAVAVPACAATLAVLAQIIPAKADGFEAGVTEETEHLISAMAACGQGDQDPGACEDGFIQACGDRRNWTTTGMVMCHSARHAFWDGALNWTYRRVMDAAEARGAEVRDMLLDAQRKWIAYRDARCRVFRYMEGTMWRPVGTDCFATMTRERTHDLETAARGLALDLAPDIEWDEADALRVDIDCDGDAETVIAGLREGPFGRSAVLSDGFRDSAIVERRIILDLPIDPQRQTGLCGPIISLSPMPKDPAHACPALRIDDGLCDAIFFSRESPAGPYRTERN